MRHSGRIRRGKIFVILSEHASVPIEGFAHTGKTLLWRRRFFVSSRQVIVFPSEDYGSQRKRGKMPCFRALRWMLP
jgi:hypothetical protein